MKKLLLLLLPALLLNSCIKEDEWVTRAKALAGTYTYTRVGKLNADNATRLPQVNMNVSGIAVITHTRDGQITITMSEGSKSITLNGIIYSTDLSLRIRSFNSKGEMIENAYNGGDFAFEHDGSGIWEGKPGPAVAHFGVYVQNCVYDIYKNILIQERYSGTFDLPSATGLDCSGSGLLSFTRQ